MSLEDFLQKLNTAGPSGTLTPAKQTTCFQGGQQRRRFEVYTTEYRYIFGWMHIVQVTLDLEATELTLELTHALVAVQGKQLGPVYEAFLKEEVGWIRAMPAIHAIPLKSEEPCIQTITVEAKMKAPPRPVRTPSFSSETGLRSTLHESNLLKDL